jgi:hypothetical protein
LGPAISVVPLDANAYAFLFEEDAMNTRDARLAVVAAAALGLYVIACRPAFSPDGSKIAFPDLNQDTGDRRVLVLDRKTGTIAPVLTVAKAETEDNYVPSTAWTPDGKELVCLWPKSDGLLHVAVIPTGAPDTKRIFDVEGDDLTVNVMLPPALVGHELFLGDKNGIAIVDLKTGKAARPEFKSAVHPEAPLKNAYVLTAGKNIFYAAGDEDSAAEVGRLERNPWRTALIREIKFTGDKGTVVAVAPFRERLAYVEGEDENQSLTFLKGAEVEKKLGYGASNSLPMIGIPMWTPDGKTLLTTGVKEDADDITSAYLCEVHVADWSHRETKLFSSTNKDEVVFTLYMLAVSPDGKTAAIPDTLREKGEHALCLVDLAGKDRKVTRVPVPAASPSKKQP